MKTDWHGWNKIKNGTSPACKYILGHRFYIWSYADSVKGIGHILYIKNLPEDVLYMCIDIKSSQNLTLSDRKVTDE